jgi:NAD(P)-dependent dehydrogenase (short-subunit alcohol dehydrogenase family)
LALGTVSLVVGVDVKTLELEKLSAASHAAADRLSVVQGDVADRATNKTAIDTAIALRARIDCVILNAAILRPVGPAADSPVEEWKRLFDVNFFSLVHAVSFSFTIPHIERWTLLKTLLLN